MGWLAFLLFCTSGYFLMDRSTSKLKRDGRSWLLRNFVGVMIAVPLALLQTGLIAGEVNAWTFVGLALAASTAWLWRQPLPDAGTVALSASETPSPAVIPPTTVASESPAPVPASGPWFAEIEFDYRDAKGNESRRRVSVEAVDDEYFQGLCHLAGAIRTFVIGRVRSKILDRETGELLAPKSWARAVYADPHNAPALIAREFKRDFRPADTDVDASGPEIEICFTGFASADKLRLEEMAEAAGMQVRHSVTAGLTHLCTGPKAGPKKISQAIERGTQLIDEGEFYVLYGNS